jgi:hypothetical protein
MRSMARTRDALAGVEETNIRFFLREISEERRNRSRVTNLTDNRRDERSIGMTRNYNDRVVWNCVRCKASAQMRRRPTAEDEMALSKLSDDEGR